MTAARVAQLNREIAEKSAELVELLTGDEPAPGNDVAPPWLSIKDFATRIRMSPRTVRRMIREGMPHERPRRRAVRIHVAEAEAWIANPERAGGSTPPPST
jgi:excisionase family DNA binding protein